MGDDSQNYIDDLLDVYGNSFLQNQQILEELVKKAPESEKPSGFYEELNNLQDLLIVLEYTKFDQRQLQPAFKERLSKLTIKEGGNPQWALAFSKLFDDLYPSAAPVMDTEMSQPYLPASIPFDLYRMEMLDLLSPSTIPDKLQDTALLEAYLGIRPVAVSEYTFAQKFNLGRLVADCKSEEKEPGQQLQKRMGAAEIAIYYIASNIGTMVAAQYLERLWSEGWIHGAVFYAVLFANLSVWSKVNQSDPVYRQGRKNYAKDILFFESNGSLSAEIPLGAAKDLFRQIKQSINEARKSADFNEWIRILHMQDLYLWAVIHLLKWSKSLGLEVKDKQEANFILRYCYEAEADIQFLISNPFYFHIGKLRSVFEEVGDLKDAKRKMRFYVHGRVSFPDSVFFDLEKVFLHAAEKPVNRVDLDQEISKTLLAHLNKGFQDAYLSVYPVDPEQIKLQEDQLETRFKESGLNSENISPKAYVIASLFSGVAQTIATRPIGGFPTPGQAQVDEKIKLFWVFEAPGKLMQLGIIEENTPAQYSFSEEPINKNPDSEKMEKYMEAELDNVRRKLDWIKELVQIVQLVEIWKGEKELSLKELVVDLNDSLTILSLKFDNRVPKTFTFVPRSFMEKEYYGLPSSYEATALGVCSAGLYAMVRQADAGESGTLNFNEIPVEAAFAKKDDGLMMMRMKDKGTDQELEENIDE